MKRSLARRRIAQKVVALAFLGLGMLTTGCSGRNVRPDGLHNTNQGATVQSIEMEDLHITVGKGGKAGEEDFTAYDAPTLFREADALFDGDKFADAAQGYEKLVVEFADSPWAPPSLFNAALSYEALGRFGEASDRYKRLLALYPTSKQAKDAALRQAACLAEESRWVQSAEALALVEKREDLSTGERLEAMARHGLALFELKDHSGAEAKFQQTLAFVESRKEAEPLPGNFFVAMSQFYIAHIAHQRFRDLPLRLPQKQLATDLDTKAKSFLLANGKYVETIKLKNPTWATAAGYHVGTLYRELYDSMIAAPVPSEVNRGDSRVIYDLLLREQLRHLLGKAKDVLESNIKMAERIGVKNGWVERSTEQLSELDKLLTSLDNPTPTATPGAAPTPSRPAPRDNKSRATL